MIRHIFLLPGSTTIKNDFNIKKLHSYYSFLHLCRKEYAINLIIIKRGIFDVTNPKVKYNDLVSLLLLISKVKENNKQNSYQLLLKVFMYSWKVLLLYAPSPKNFNGDSSSFGLRKPASGAGCALKAGRKTVVG